MAFYLCETSAVGLQALSLGLTNLYVNDCGVRIVSNKNPNIRKKSPPDASLVCKKYIPAGDAHDVYTYYNNIKYITRNVHRRLYVRRESCRSFRSSILMHAHT